MAHVLQCGDVIPGCAAVLEADGEDDLLAKVSEHAKNDHQLDEIDDETLAAVRSKIRTS